PFSQLLSSLSDDAFRRNRPSRIVSLQDGFDHRHILQGFFRRVPMRRAFTDGSRKSRQFTLDAAARKALAARFTTAGDFQFLAVHADGAALAYNAQGGRPGRGSGVSYAQSTYQSTIKVQRRTERIGGRQVI